MVGSVSLFDGIEGFEEAQKALEELNKSKRGPYNKVPKPKHTDNEWEQLRKLYSHLADFLDLPRFQVKEDGVFLFAGGKIRGWCSIYNQEV